MKTPAVPIWRALAMSSLALCVVLTTASSRAADALGGGASSQAISVPQGPGKIEGLGESFSTQPSTGAVTFGLPFAMPTARGGVQPTLGVSYSSQGGHGVAGVGWDMPMPFIARQTHRGVPKYDDPRPGEGWHPEQDRFVFGGGQELVPIGLAREGACPGALPDEVMPAWADGWQYFRPRVEGSFLRFFWSPDHRTWRVQSKTGVTMELGVPLDGTGYVNALEQNPDNFSQIYRWNLIRQFDAQGTVDAPVNVVTYRYALSGGIAYLTDVYDTPRRGDTASIGGYAHHTRLIYEPRTDPTFSYRRGWRTDTTQRLRRVDVTSYNRATVGRELVRRYHLHYDPTYHPSLLTQVQMEGRCGSFVEGSGGELPETTGCPRMPPVTFDYEHVTPMSQNRRSSATPFVGYEAVDARIHVFGASPSYALRSERANLMDINGDGLPDLVVTNVNFGKPWHLAYINQGDQFKEGVPMGVVGDTVMTPNALQWSDKNVVALDLDGDGRAELVYMSRPRQYSVFLPTFAGGQWQWNGRNVRSATAQSQTVDFASRAQDVRVMDVDDDGLVDVVFTGGERIQTLFSLGRYPGGHEQFGTARWTSADSADLSLEQRGALLPDSSGPVRFGSGDVFIADMNGDELPDIVRVRDGNIVYWPGRGDGSWGATVGAGGKQRGDAISMTRSPHSSNMPTGVRLDDVNGDGLADLVTVSSSGVEVWLNVDGVSWTTGFTIQHPTDDAREVRLVDLLGTGTRAIVWGQGYGFRYADLLGGTRPWLLTHIDNGLGKTTKLEYASSTKLMLAAERVGTPWTSKTPVPVPVLVRKTDRDNLERAAGKAGVYVSDHQYRDPLYDGRQREFRGFRSATTSKRGDANSPTVVEEATFLLGDCESDGMGPDPCALEERWRDNPREALKGVPVVSEIHDEAGVALSTTHHTYRLRHLYTGLDGRAVRSAMVSATDSWVYETNPFAPGGGTVPQNDVELELVAGQATQGSRRDMPLRGSRHSHTRIEHRFDFFGNVLASVKHGQVGRDEVLTTHTLVGRPPQDATGWMFRTESSWVSGNQHAGSWHKRDFAYDARGNLTETSDELSGTLPLHRFHESASHAVAPSPPGASRDGMIRKMFVHDIFGNVTRVVGSDHRCSSVGYDPTYADLPIESTTYVGAVGAEGCGTLPLRTTAEYDRAFGIVTDSTSERGERTRAEYDGFGRVLAVYKPSVTEIGALSGVPALRVGYQVTTDPGARPYSIVHVQTHDGSHAAHPRHRYAYVDGLGRTIVTLGQADPSAGDKAAWIASGWTVHNAKGQIERAYEPMFSSRGPEEISFMPPIEAAYVRTEHAAFGRATLSFGLDGAVTSKTVHHAHSADVWDAADLGNGPHGATPVTVETDGHGRAVKTIERTRDQEAVTEMQYLPGGEPETITRSGGARRSMHYDSLGRLVLNVDPTTSGSTGGSIQAWRYAYNDAGDVVGTSDARGCGVNTHYDSGGRLLAKDYSPCLASHADYSAPDLETGDGTEVFIRYDVPDPDAAEIGGFPINPSAYLGRPASISSRGAKSVIAYDPRGRPILVARRITKPGEPSRSLTHRYAPRWYAQSVTFDEADRPVIESTGADWGTDRVEELLGTDGTSAIVTRYTQRGSVLDVHGSYGPLVKRILRNAQGQPVEMEYGDRARTTTEWTYDVRRRVNHIWTYRAPPSEWTAQAASESFAQYLEDSALEYDEVDNPVMIRDERKATEWPEGGKPVHRRMEYDALYRLTHIAYEHGSDVWTSPFDAENHERGRDPKQASSAPHVGFDGRVREQTFRYDALGNLTQSDDDEHAFFDRSLGSTVHHPDKPYQLVSASHEESFRAGKLSATYDAAGNLSSLAVTRKGTCVPISASCNQRFVYDWDEIGQLARARRWDGEGSDNAQGPPPAGNPEVDLTFAYDDGGQRTLKTALSGDGTEVHSAYIFGSLELRRALWTLVDGSDDRDYERSVQTEVVHLSAQGVRLGRVAYGVSDQPSSTSGRRRVFLELSDPLGSTSSVVDHDTGELVEHITYQAYGATESDVRPERWRGFREDYRFTGKEEDVEVGLVYFGARYYAPALSRWISPDPLTIHELGADLNPYAYVHGRVLQAVDPIGLSEAVNPSPSIVGVASPPPGHPNAHVWLVGPHVSGDDLQNYGSPAEMMSAAQSISGAQIQYLKSDSELGLALVAARERAGGQDEPTVVFEPDRISASSRGLSGHGGGGGRTIGAVGIAAQIAGIASDPFGTAYSMTHAEGGSPGGIPGGSCASCGGSVLAQVAYIVLAISPFVIGHIIQNAIEHMGAAAVDAIGAAALGPRVFWSGGPHAMNAAANYAHASGGVSLEMTAAARGIEAMNLEYQVAAPLWRAASASFAEGAAGQAHVFLAGAYSNSIWRTVELPALKANPLVTSIRYHLALIP